MRVLDGIWERIVNAAKGAALGTGTTMELEMTGAVWNVLPEHLSRRLDAEEPAAASAASSTRRHERAVCRGDSQDARRQPAADRQRESGIHAGAGIGSASTDLGDVSWRVPTVQLTAATWVPGTPAHSWQAVAAGGTSIGVKGMMVAAKTMALTAIDLFTDPTHIVKGARRVRQAARADLQVHDPAGRSQAGAGLSEIGLGVCLGVLRS